MRTTIGICLVLTAANLAAQDEGAFLKRQAGALHKFAAQAFRTGYPSMARPIWLEVLAEYDKDHAATRKALGYIKFNTVWALQDGFEYPDGDNPSVSAAKSLSSKWGGVARVVGEAHKKIAKEFEASGRTDRANYHTARALRFLPDDPEVRAAMGHRKFGGMSGTEVEETLFKRSREMDAVVARESKKNYEVKAVTEKQPAFLTAAGLTCIGVRSENFTIWGEWRQETLMEGARFSERSLAFCKEILVGAPNFGRNTRTRTFLFLKGHDNWKKVLAKTPSLIPDDQHRKFIIDNGAATNISHDGVDIRGVGVQDVPTIYDGCVRFVVSAYCGLRSDAMNAGTGHAVVGRFLGQNRMFAIAQAKNTITANSRKLLLPDMDTWSELAVEAAFNPRGTKAAQLPLLKASRFPTDGRIKAWSFCDYLLRRDPNLLVQLDACNRQRNPGAVNVAFEGKAGIPLGKLEQEWKDFWTGASPVLAKLRNRVPALDMVSQGGKRWLDGFNKARRQHGVEAVSWNASYSRNCQQHAEYLAANRKARGAGPEHAQRAGTTGATNAGSAFASMALVVTKGSPAKVMKDWIHIPGYRDALIHPYLATVGVYSQGSIAVFDVVRGMAFTERVRFGTYPPAGSTDRPNRVAVKLLGPEVESELKKRKIRSKTIGYPISLHGWRAGTVPASVEVDVKQGGDAVAGFVIVGGRNRYAGAPGLAVFYPLEPLKSGVSVSVVFKRPGGATVQNWRFTPK